MSGIIFSSVSAAGSAVSAVTGGFCSAESAYDYSRGAADSGRYGYGIDRAIYSTGAAFHTTILILNLCFAFENSDDAVRTNFLTPPAPDARILIEFECCYVF